MLKWIFKKWIGVVDWIDLALERDRGWTVVNVVMDLWVPYNARIFWTI